MEDWFDRKTLWCWWWISLILNSTTQMSHLQKALKYFQTKYPLWESNDKMATDTWIHNIGRRSSDLKSLGLVEKQEIVNTDGKWRRSTTTVFRCTEKWLKTNPEKVFIAYSSNKEPRSSIEESIVKQQNKILNDKEFIKYENFKKEFYWNDQECKWERWIQFITPPPIQTNIFVSIRHSLFSNKN
jgi:hypothetical protein